MCAVAGIGLAAMTAGPTQAREPGASVEAYLPADEGLTQAERRRLAAGEAVTKLLDVEVGSEVAVFGAIWIEAPMRRYVDLLQDIERYEHGGGFKVTRRIGVPPRLEDFADLHLPERDARDLRGCRVGDCNLKLDEETIRRLHEDVDWGAPEAAAAANAVARRFAFDYVNGYLAGGNGRLAVYRDHSRPTISADEFRGMVDHMPQLTTYLPQLRWYLLGYPRVTLPDATSFLYWQVTEFGLKPTFRISHLTIWNRPDQIVVASKMLYASHYFRTGLELRALIPDAARGEGFWLVIVNWCRADGLGGFLGPFVRSRVRSQVEDRARAALESTRRRLEAAAPVTETSS